MMIESGIPQQTGSNALKEGLLKDPEPGSDVPRLKLEDSTRTQLEELRAELLRNQNPTFQERAQQVLQQLKELLTPRPHIQTAEPEPFSKVVRGSSPTKEQTSPKTDQLASS
jgi:hypothetical protein